MLRSPHKRLIRRVLSAVALSLALASPAGAGAISHEGVTFAEASENVRILGLSVWPEKS